MKGSDKAEEGVKVLAVVVVLLCSTAMRGIDLSSFCVDRVWRITTTLAFFPFFYI
jgi:hypothetical protein